VVPATSTEVVDLTVAEQEEVQQPVAVLVMAGLPVAVAGHLIYVLEELLLLIGLW
jgi:hypothetical protein